MEYFSSNIKKKQFLIAGFCVVILVGLTKDIVDAYINDYSFYISESILFNTFWILFLPIIFLQTYYLRKNKKHRKTQIFISIFLFYTLQLLVFSSVVFLLSKIFYGHTYDFLKTFATTIPDSLIPCFIIFAMNGLYNFYNELKNKTGGSKKYLTTIPVKSNKNTSLIRINEIIYIKSETPYISLITAKNTFLYTSSLKSFLEKIDPNTFIRVHKTMIVNISHVVSSTSRKNGDYDLKMANKEVIRLSRNYSDAFKKHFLKPSG